MTERVTPREATCLRDIIRRQLSCEACFTYASAKIHLIKTLVAAFHSMAQRMSRDPIMLNVA